MFQRETETNYIWKQTNNTFTRPYVVISSLNSPRLPPRNNDFISFRSSAKKISSAFAPAVLE